ncbi:hypothetical protein LTS18_014523, partial [Coniosporium uncinatum]
MPYKFTGAAASHNFNDAPQAITATRARLDWASKQLPFVGEDHIEFNEVLALGYFENQAINYHDDGEQGLGPTIATLSLGYPAKMSLRLKDKHYRGVSKSGEYTDEPPIPGCQHYEARRGAHTELDGLSSAERKTKKKELVDRLQLGKKHADVKDSQRKHAPDAISFKLCHGDIVVMHGEGVQKYYEHEVIPEGTLRFALTCRYIAPEHLKEHERPSYEVKPMTEEEKYDGSKLPQVEDLEI